MASSKRPEATLPEAIKWGRFRYSVVSRIDIATLQRGELAVELRALASRDWEHPITGEVVRFAVSTIEGWYYKAKKAANPIEALSRKVRKDAGTFRAISDRLAQLIRRFHRKKRKTWSHLLHYQNIKVYVADRLEYGPVPSYATIRRYRKSKGMLKLKRSRNDQRPGAQRAAERLEEREVRSFEKEHVNELWHLDFHHCSRAIVSKDGTWCYPVLLGIMDDHSRHVVHLQWYLNENAESLVHGLIQAFEKAGLPRAIMHDNGSPMKAAEFLLGLVRLSVESDPTLEYSPWQNGKLETFWDPFEGRCMAMLVDCKEITLGDLNRYTAAWVAGDYRCKIHSETQETPLRRFLDGVNVGRTSPAHDELVAKFGCRLERRVRRSDGTIPLENIRFEIPSRFRHLSKVMVRYARWDLSKVYLEDPKTGYILTQIRPVDKSKNADGRRRRLPNLAGAEPQNSTPLSGEDELDHGPAPLMRKLLEQYAQTGLPLDYIPKDE